jgi:hypothetical protein
MRAETKDRRAFCGLITADSFENPSTAVQAMGRDVQSCLVPGNDGSVLPDKLAVEERGIAGLKNADMNRTGSLPETLRDERS